MSEDLPDLDDLIRSALRQNQTVFDRDEAAYRVMDENEIEMAVQALLDPLTKRDELWLVRRRVKE